MQRPIAICLCLLLLCALGVDAALRQGDRGGDVVELQKFLQQLGYYGGVLDGIFGSQTTAAVKAFQQKQNLVVDGIAGEQTLTALSRLTGTKISSRSNRVALLSWNEANATFPVGTVAKIMDVNSGRTMYIKRRGGQYHADCEPLSHSDTQTLRSIYGGSWSWDRRAVLVELGGQWVAASINGMPHGQSSIDNGFSGHFCVHFYGSKTHGGGKSCPLHQQQILYAAGRR